MKPTIRWQLSIVVATAIATLSAACTDRYRNPADDPRNQPTETQAPTTEP
jgi:hypothetical protein